MNLLRAIARPLLATPFILDGISALRSPEDHVERIERIRPVIDKIPGVSSLDTQTLTTITRGLGALTIGTGVAFAFGKFPRSSALLLASVAAPTALVNNPVWTGRTAADKRDMLSGLALRGALVGAMLIASTDRVGRPSTAWRVNSWRKERRLEREARQKAIEAAKRREERVAALKEIAA
ncbi:MAG: DoxX family membrane protein [Actinomycetaceae bacterium]|nr:DoxX family membrane protein [Actinomycetaceae bacterium]